MPTLQELEAEKARRAQGASPAPTLADLEAEKARRTSPTSDVLRSAPSGLRLGTEFLMGLPGDVNEMTQNAASRISRAIFGDQATETMKQYVPTGLRSEGFRTPQVQEASEQLLGPNYDPKTRAGRYTQSVFEQVPGMVLGPGGKLTKIAQALFAGGGGEFAAEQAEGTGWEDTARMGGNIVGALAGGRMRPGPTTREAAREANVATLDREGVPMTSGQRTGSTRAQYIESELGGSAFDKAIDRQRSVFTDAAMRRLGEAGGPALPEDLARARARIGGEFDRLSAGTAVPFDQQLQNDLLASAVDYQEIAPQVAPAVENLMNRMAEMASRNGGMLGGENYKEMVTKLRQLSDSADVPTGEALGAFRNALDDAVERQLAGPALDEWRNARRQYANLMTVSRAMTGGGVEQASGMISPVRLRSAISGGGQGPAAIAEGRSSMADLANAGVGVTKDLPQSGTAPRAGARAIPATVAGVGTGYLTGDLSSAALAAGAGFALPEIVGGAVMSRPGQALMRGLPDDQRMVLSAILAARQGQMGAQR